MTLFPLALPIILLTAAAATPFLLVPLAVGLVITLLAVPILLLRRLLRMVRFARHSNSGGAAPAVPTLPATSGC
jgi:hypothetical protein